MSLDDKNIKLVELAHTWQGEGPSTGRQMLIARYKYCNKNCQYCDTMIKMRTTIEGTYSINELNEALKKTSGLMITGGEPTLQTLKIDNLVNTMNMLQNCECQVINIETNGCNITKLLMEIKSMRFSERNIDLKIMYSPKVFTTEDYTTELNKARNVIDNQYVYLKIVADKTALTENYIREVSKMTSNRGKIYLMPLGITTEEIMQNWGYCIDLADELNLNISTRMHIVNQFT